MDSNPNHSSNLNPNPNPDVTLVGGRARGCGNELSPRGHISGQDHGRLPNRLFAQWPHLRPDSCHSPNGNHRGPRVIAAQDFAVHRQVMVKFHCSEARMCRYGPVCCLGQITVLYPVCASHVNTSVATRMCTPPASEADELGCRAMGCFELGARGSIACEGRLSETQLPRHRMCPGVWVQLSCDSHTQYQ